MQNMHACKRTETHTESACTQRHTQSAQEASQEAEAQIQPSEVGVVPSAGPPDSRYIRVETCMFMIKLPQYSSLEIMLEKLRCAIHYREDPLSG